MTDRKLYQYYETQALLPTFGDFRDEDDLDRHTDARRVLFTEKLALPPAVFRDAELIEFGPDSGENAMVFARWGARLTLVEPNERSLSQIRNYFSRFGLEPALKDLVQADVERFDSARTFDIIDAEGFIHSVQPAEQWLSLFHRLLSTEGFAVISYYERSGAIFELALRAIYLAGRALTGQDPRSVADMLFAQKWSSIPHIRSMDSWVMDVLESPFVRLRYFLDAEDLCRRAHAAGFAVHASWPVYRDMLMVHWHKKICSADEALMASVVNIRRSRLSFAAGRKLYLTGDESSVLELARTIDDVAAAIDALCDEPVGQSIGTAIRRIQDLDRLVATASILADGPDALDKFRSALNSLTRILELIGRGNIAGIAAITCSDAAFIAEWGSPAHFLVLRKRTD